MSNRWLPTITMTFDGLKGAIEYCLTDWQIKSSEIIRQSVESYCRPENIQAAVDEEVRKTIDEAVKKEIRDFFQYSGPGRAAIREVVRKKLEQSIRDDELMGRVYGGGGL